MPQFSCFPPINSGRPGIPSGLSWLGETGSLGDVDNVGGGGGRGKGRFHEVNISKNEMYIMYI